MRSQLAIVLRRCAMMKAAALEQMIQSFLNFLFAFGVEGARGFVQNQNRSVFENRTSDADPLLFAARKHAAAFADSRLVVVGIVIDKSVGICHLRCADDSVCRFAKVS